MQELKFIGVDEGALVVSADDGRHFRITIDDALRDALRPRVSTRVDAPRVAPREIQQLIRSGKSVEEVVAETGADHADVARFEGPILAERAYIVEQARGVSVRTSADVDPLGDGAFGEAIDERLEQLAASGVRWDAWKDVEAGWRVGLSFHVDSIARDALWAFEPKSHSLRPLNQTATTLSQLHTELSSLGGGPRLRAVDAAVEPPREDAAVTEPAATEPVAPELRPATPRAHEPERDERERPGRSAEHPSRGHGGDAPAPRIQRSSSLAGREEGRPHAWVGAAASGIGAVGSPQASQQFNETSDLLEALRRRRGERDPHPGFEDDDEHATPGEQGGEGSPAPVTVFPRAHRTGAAPRAGVGDDERAHSGDGGRATGAFERGSARATVHETGTVTVDRSPSASAGSPNGGRDERDGQDAGADRTSPQGAGRKRGRPSMPSWDEIVFGTRPDDR